MIELMIVEDNERLRTALKTGFEAAGGIHVCADSGSGEEALSWRRQTSAGSIDGRASAGVLYGIQTAIACAAIFPRLPVVFYFHSG
jgi:DNA-binding NarL/FixJ family response regulator